MRRLAARVLLLAASVAACAGSADSGTSLHDAGTSADAPGASCQITFSPFAPEASATMPIRAVVDPGAAGVFTYSWSVYFGSTLIAHTQESADGDSIGFIAENPGIYDVNVLISGGFTLCTSVNGQIRVADPNGTNNNYRLRAAPPTNLGVPPQEQLLQIVGTGDVLRDITLDPGIDADGFVRNGPGGPGVPAYVKFMPVSAPLAFTELFTTAAGAYSTKLVGIAHDVLVIPQSTSLAPKRVQWTATTTELVVGPGTLVSGTVRNPAGTGLAGAKVQLVANGTPSTTGTTDGSGNFMLRADYPAASMITVKVTPPATSGLPRLEATAQLTLTSALDINYAAGLQTCDLSNTPVRRNTTNQGGAKVTVVGALAGSAGTITAGASAAATGSVRVTATADGAGRLPSMLVPRSNALSAVVELGTNDYAVDALDTSACAVAQIDAPALVQRAGTTKDANNTLLGGIRIEATPIAALALADAKPVAATTNSSGAYTISLASGGRYDVRFLDPDARVATRQELDVAPAGIPMDAILPKALAIRGKVAIATSSQALPGTSIQLLCATCTGVDATRPIGQTATNGASEYRVAVPDPGSM